MISLVFLLEPIEYGQFLHRTLRLDMPIVKLKIERHILFRISGKTLLHLLTKHHGPFSSLVWQSGPPMYSALSEDWFKNNDTIKPLIIRTFVE